MNKTSTAQNNTASALQFKEFGCMNCNFGILKQFHTNHIHFILNLVTYLVILKGLIHATTCCICSTLFVVLIKDKLFRVPHGFKKIVQVAAKELYDFMHAIIVK